MENIKSYIVMFLIIGVVFGGVVFINTKKDSNNNVVNDYSSSKKQVDKSLADNVSDENGKQIIEIKVDNGYSPKISTAKSGIETEIKFVSNGGYDCSHSVNIPSIGYVGKVPSTGSTIVDLGIQQPGSKIAGVCGMGMYKFNINFN